MIERTIDCGDFVKLGKDWFYVCKLALAEGVLWAEIRSLSEEKVVPYMELKKNGSAIVEKKDFKLLESLAENGCK